MTMPFRTARAAVLLLLCLAHSVVGGREVIRERFSDPSPHGLTLLGSARLVGGPSPHVALTGEDAGELGLIWFEPAIDPGRSLIAVNFDYSLAVPAGANGALAGGCQLILQFGDDLAAAGRGGDSLGTGDFPTGYLGVAIDPGPDPSPDLRSPHLEVNLSSDPAVDPPVAFSTDIPPVPVAGAEVRFRITVVIDGASVTVIVVSDQDCHGAREVISTSLPAPPGTPMTVGFAATGGASPVTHRIHAVTVTAEQRQGHFLRGDCNQDGKVCGSVSDMIAIVQRCFLAGPPLQCEDACDANDDGTVCGSVSDIAFLANHCFLGTGPPLPTPAVVCGADPTADGIDCQTPSCGTGDDTALIVLGENDSGYQEYFRTRDAMVMVRIPAGGFEQGDHYLDRGGDELPVHPVLISSPFLLAKYEVTNRQYRMFLDAIGCEGLGCSGDDLSWDFTGFTGFGGAEYDGCHYPAGVTSLTWGLNENYFEDVEFADYPVVWVDWFDAVAYGRWANAERSTDWEDSSIYGIPSESRWEYAARWDGDDVTPRRYPWGGNVGLLDSPANINPERCNYGNTLGRTVPVCSYPSGRSRFGVHNQSGNVYEWTADWYDGNLYKDSPVTDPFATSGDIKRQLRGGGWFGVPFSVRGAYRCGFPQNQPDVDVGIRCASVDAGG